MTFISMILSDKDFNTPIVVTAYQCQYSERVLLDVYKGSTSDTGLPGRKRLTVF